MVTTEILEEKINEIYKKIVEYLKKEGIKINPKVRLKIIKDDINPKMLDIIISPFILTFGMFLTLPKEIEDYAYINFAIYFSQKHYNKKPDALYNDRTKTIYIYLPEVLEKLSYLINAKNNLDKESLDNILKKIGFHNRTVRELSPHYDRIAEILIIPPKPSDGDIIRRDLTLAISHEIAHALNGKLKLFENVDEYIASVLETLLYFKLNLGDNKLDNGIFEILYKYNPHYEILNSVKSSYKYSEKDTNKTFNKSITKLLKDLMKKDPYSLGRYTAYYILEKYGLENIRIKDIYEKLRDDPFYFLKEYFMQCK